MRLVDRLSVFLISILAMIISIAIFLLSIGKLAIGQHLLSALHTTWALHAAIAASIILLLAFNAMLLSTRTVQNDRGIKMELSLGELRTSYGAIENLLKRSLRQISGLREVKPRVYSEKGEIKVILKITVIPDINIPDLAARIQQRVKDEIGNTVGVLVNQVVVNVENISTELPARVE